MTSRGGAQRGAAQGGRPDSPLERLYGLAGRGALLGLDRVRDACGRFGNPEARFDSLHIGGTNGKGSVAAMTAAMARAAGKRTGLYTSPHLCRFAERVQIDGAPVPDGALFEALDDVLVRCPELTFFETATVAAFRLFARARVELAVIEVGLGGRLDATNVLVSPVATAITSVGLDHTDRLGGDLASIAREKAGILKPRVPAVVGLAPPPAMAEIAAAARRAAAPVTWATVDAALASFVEDHPPALAGRHQRHNARVAVALGRLAGLPDREIARGLSEVLWPGRLESLATPEGEVLLDGAHNPDGARALAGALRERGLAAGRVALVFGAMADKDWRAMLDPLGGVAAHRVYVAPEGRRAAELEALAGFLSGVAAEGTEAALSHARRAVGPTGLVVVTGSIFLVGAARALLLDLPRDPAVGL